MVIVTDFDDIMNELLMHWLEYLNVKYGTKVLYEDVTDWDMSKAFPDLTDNQLYSLLEDEDFWNGVEPNYQAIYYIHKLIKEGHKVYVCTASKYTTLKAKFDNCLFKYFDYLTYKDIITCHDKSLIQCDVIIDDYWENIKNSKAITILKNAPYNKNADPHFEVNDWKEIYEIIQNLEYVRNCEKES